MITHDYCNLFAGAKLYQAKRFNDPTDPCDVMVATDAVGMGINLYVNTCIVSFICGKR